MPFFEREYSGFRCYVSVPISDPPAGGWPILVFLHGRDECAPRGLVEAMTAHGPLRRGSAREAVDNFVVVAPQLAAPGGNVWPRNKNAVADLPRAIARDERVDLSQAYLTGFSFGGNGVLEIGSSTRDTWAALWAVDPPGSSVHASDQPIWVSAGRYSRDRRSSFAALHDRQPNVPPHGTRVFHDAGLDHVPTAAAAYSDTAVYNWLLTHRSG